MKANFIITAVLSYLVLALADESSNSSSSSSLKCPSSDSGGDSGSNYYSSTTNHELQDYSNGALGISMIRGIRNKPQSFYQSVVNNTVMSLCDVENESDRCVDADSTLAAKDWEEKCVVTLDSSCEIGTCERTSNCYWNSAVPGKNRTTRYPKDEYEDANDRLWGKQKGSYARGIANFAAVGIIIAVVLSLFWVIFFIGRYCCCCLWTSTRICAICSPIPREEGYFNCREIVFPLFLYFVCLIGIAVSGSLAFVGNEDINFAASNVFYHSSELVEDLGLFLARSRKPLSNIQQIINEAAVDAKGIFDDTDYVKATALSIMAAFEDFGTLHIEGLEVSNSQSGFAAAIDGFESQVTPVVDNIQNMLDTLELDLYDNVDIIQSSVTSAIGQIDSFKNQTSLWLEEIYDIEGREYELRAIRKASIMGVFLFSLTVAFAGFIGILSSKSSRCKHLFHLIKIAGFLCALLGTIVLLLAAASLSVSVLWYDACEISSIVTSDFEPYVGDKIAPGANACFNDTNLAVAFNVTDKVDFQGKLDEGLSVMAEVNITENFDLVLSPLRDIQDLVSSITTTALGVFNQATAFDSETCPFDDTYTKSTILEPWTANIAKDKTAWVLNATGTEGDYNRQGSENRTRYIGRIYDMAGVCTSSSSCCLNNFCGVVENSPCNSGDNCAYVCSDLGRVVVGGYKAYLEADNIESRLSADLGVQCPSRPDISCPTLEFQNMGNDYTLVALVKAYRSNITDTADDLVDVASTSVGSAMDEVQNFLCNMNVSFVGRRYNQIRDDVCITMFGGVTQVNWALWVLAIFLEITAILANILSTRLRGVSREKAALGELDDTATGRSRMSRAELYG